ncbi:cytochrome C oxidase subunit I [Streptomyces sp. NPDC056224]|uniref:cytochrome C oxidase subunit I n=1 Tax=Streptomyces sp. NPDC056224 TaxID=3345750 RepID=UPI0035DB4C6A
MDASAANDSGGQPAASVKDGLRSLDGYLYWQNELTRAHREAVAFCDQLTWLTTNERQELERLYAGTRIETAKATTRHLAHRCTQLRAEYEDRYRTLRLRTFALALAVIATTAACPVLLLLRS